MTRPRILVVHGARATEERLLARLAQLHQASRRDFALLARPVRVVVPSINLRDHLSSLLVRRFGALAGCQVMTLFSAALELLAASGRPAGRGTALFDVLVRRFARLEPPLADRLEDLVDGYAVVSGTVRDFFDAGFEPVHREAHDELLAEQADWSRDEIDRARALVNVTAATQAALGELGLDHRSGLLRAAGEALEAAGPDLLPTRELLVHGFADATGVVTDFIESLLRVLGGTLYLDRPPGEAGAWAHAERFTVRLSQVASLEDAPLEDGEDAVDVNALPAPELFAAPDPDAEMREIARRVRKLLADGARAESIGLVARDLRTRDSRFLGLLVRRHFRALGIPFSAVHAPGPVGPVGRDLAVLAELLRRGPALVLERWLDALRRLPASGVELDPGVASGLRLALFGCGASRLEDLARVEIPAEPAADRIDRGVLDGALAAGRALAVELEAWREPPAATYAGHAERLGRVLERHLGWRRTHRLVMDLVEALDVPRELPLSYEEFTLVVLESLAGRSHEPLGGRGGGVQVLDAMEARGLTFEHLFVFAVGRDVFPRAVHEDPLLPDRWRRDLVKLLPDLPVKAAGHDEERYLFAQLLSAAPRVTVSWHEADGTGKAVAPSPLVERLRRRAAVERAPRLLAPVASAWRPVAEELLVSAIHGDRARFAQILPLALEDDVLARARLAVLDEMDPDRGTSAGRRRGRQLGPYFGYLGAVALPEDPRHGDIFITTLENLAVCPWQTFLGRLLRVAPMPDPLASLPTLRGLLVGNLVHEVLERIVREALGGRRFDRHGVAVAWPEPPVLEAWLAEEAEGVLRRQGLGLKGLARAAVELARPYLEAARELDWAGRPPRIHGVETNETLHLADRSGHRRRVRFKADRVDGDGSERVYTDYKTGARRKTRQDARDNLRQLIAGGEWLQAAAYAHGDASAGRYLFLRPDLDDEDRVLTVQAADEDLRTTFDETVRVLLAAWDAGTFFPRLVEPDEDVEPPRCSVCRVAEACLRRDSGARGRLRRWAEAREAEAEGEEKASPFLDVWRLRKRSE